MGKKLAEIIKPETVITCQGPLGSGKTTFVQGLANGLGIDKPIISPTFIYIRHYSIPKYSLRFNHADLYRLTNLDEILSIDLLGLINRKSITIIEWPEIIHPYLPPGTIKIKFEYGQKDNERIITIDQSNPDH